jgi:K+-sensing histidine kinase KdpD
MNENISDKEQFFSKVSHDLRGAFTSILGFSEILNDPNENLYTEEITEYSQRISSQSKDTFELLTNFINWLKLERFDYGITNENTDIFDLLQSVHNFHRKFFEKKSIQIVINANPDYSVFMDYEIVQSILNNIFVFLLKTCSENSKIVVNVNNSLEKFLLVEISATCQNANSSFFQNIDLRDLNNELSFPIIFAIKFTELSKGRFNFSFENNNLLLELKLPKD